MDFFPTAGGGGLDRFSSMPFLCVFLLIEYFIVLCNRFKTYKNPNENPDLPMDFKNLRRKPKV
jgi:hypothetical protein